MSVSQHILDEGGNYRIALEHDATGRHASVGGRLDVLVVSVWRREDLSSTEGADLAARMTDSLLRAMQGPGVHALILDLSQAPPIMGPRTLATIGELIEKASALQQGVRVVAGASATGRLQLERLVRDRGPDGVVVSSLEEARAARPRRTR